MNYQHAQILTYPHHTSTVHVNLNSLRESMDVYLQDKAENNNDDQGKQSNLPPLLGSKYKCKKLGVYG